MGAHYRVTFVLYDVTDYTEMIMSTQMRVEQRPEGWAVLNAGTTVAIKGQVYHAEREALVGEIESRGLFVWSDGSIAKDVEHASEPDPGYTPPTPGPTEDPPTDPGADPEDPDSHPTVPAKPKKVRTKMTITAPGEESSTEINVEADLETGTAKRVVAELEFPITDDNAKASAILMGIDGDKVDTTEDLRREVDAATAKRGRVQRKPATSRFTAEQRKARAEYAKKYRAQMSEEQKEKARAAAKERQKRWRENNPAKASEFAKRSSARRKERYNEDPAFRAEYRAKQKAYVESRQAEQKSDLTE